MIKEDLATYRAFLVFLATSLFGIIGYAMINLDSLNIYQLILGVLANVFILITFIFLLKKYLKSRETLKELK